MALNARIRIGSVPYLNAKVLVWGLESQAEKYSLEFDTPSVLVERLRADELDIALVSSIEYFRAPGYRIVPELGICGRSEMWSIKLFHRCDLRDMKRVGLDPASETTNALLRIILEEYMGFTVTYVSLGRDEDPLARSDLDGFLKIGDPCLAFSSPEHQAFDLLGAWQEWTGLPFVFAVWLVRDGVDLGGVEEELKRAREEGMRHVDAIAKAYHEITGISQDKAEIYVSRIIRYDLGEAELKGLAKFQEYLLKLEYIEKSLPVNFYY